MAGRRADVHGLRQFGIAHPSVALKPLEDAAIDAVEGFR
jgi:hypothetical protein